MPAGLERFGLCLDLSDNALVLETTMGPKPTTLQRFDTAPALRGTLYDAEGVVVDLTGATLTVDMRRRFSYATPKIAAASVTILDATAGRFEYAWAAADTNEPGTFDLWIRVAHVGGARESFPNKGAHEVIVRR